MVGGAAAVRQCRAQPAASAGRPPDPGCPGRGPRPGPGVGWQIRGMNVGAPWWTGCGRHGGPDADRIARARHRCRRTPGGDPGRRLGGRVGRLRQTVVWRARRARRRAGVTLSVLGGRPDRGARRRRLARSAAVPDLRVGRDHHDRAGDRCPAARRAQPGADGQAGRDAGRAVGRAADARRGHRLVGRGVRRARHPVRAPRAPHGRARRGDADALGRRPSLVPW